MTDSEARIDALMIQAWKSGGMAAYARGEAPSSKKTGHLTRRDPPPAWVARGHGMTWTRRPDMGDVLYRVVFVDRASRTVYDKTICFSTRYPRHYLALCLRKLRAQVLSAAKGKP